MNVDITFNFSQISGEPILMNNWTKMSCGREQKVCNANHKMQDEEI